MEAIFNPRSILILFILVVVCIACVWMMENAMSAHSTTAHAGQRYNSIQVLDMLDAQLTAPESGPCKKLEVAICLFATNHDKLSWNYGKPSPQARGYCDIDANQGVMGVFGLAKLPEVVYVTGYQLPYKQWQFYNERDLCVAGDATYLKNIIAQAMR